MGAAADCERILSGLLGQPTNTLTTLAFIVAGSALLRMDRLRWVGVALVSTGVGSFLFHGPMPAWAEWAHDVSLAWLILIVAGLGSRFEKWTQLPGLAALGVVFALLPAAGDPVGAGLAVVAVIAIVRDEFSVANLAPLVALAVVAVLGRLGATGGPLCVPPSIWQWHGLWHVGAAGAVAWWAWHWADRQGLYRA